MVHIKKLVKKIPLKVLMPLTFILIIIYGVIFNILTGWEHFFPFVIILALATIIIFKVFLTIDLSTKHKITDKFVATEFIIFLITFLVMVYLMAKIDVQMFQIFSSATLTIISLILVTSIETIYEYAVLSNKYISQTTYDRSYNEDLRLVKISGVLLLFFLLTLNLTIIIMNTFNENLWKSYETLDSDESHIEVKKDSKGQRYIDKSQTTFYLKSGDKVEIK